MNLFIFTALFPLHSETEKSDSMKTMHKDSLSIFFWGSTRRTIWQSLCLCHAYVYKGCVYVMPVVIDEPKLALIRLIVNDVGSEEESGTEFGS